MVAGRDGAMTSGDPFAELRIPLELEENLRHHREHLARLVMSLQSAGVREEQIEASISVLVASYKEELLRTMKRIAGERD